MAVDESEGERMIFIQAEEITAEEAPDNPCIY
jgi:hypothetical protein